MVYNHAISLDEITEKLLARRAETCDGNVSKAVRQFILESTDPAMRLRWAIRDGIYDFKAPLLRESMYRGNPATHEYIVAVTWVQGRAGRGELYRLSVDPWQDHNLVKDPRYQAQKKVLRRMTQQYIDCAGATCPQDFYR